MATYKLQFLLVMLVYIRNKNGIGANIISHTIVHRNNHHNSTNLSDLNKNLISPSSFNTDYKRYRGNLTLGENCRKDNDCYAAGAICTNNTCRCDTYLQEHEIQNECLGSKLHEPCIEDYQCFIEIGNSLCFEGYCKCSDSYPLEEDLKCRPDYHVGDKCNISAECAHKRLACINGVCNCSSSKLVLFQNKCYEKVLIGGNCFNDAQCQAFIAGTICEHTCRCNISTEIASVSLKRCVPDSNNDAKSSNSLTFELLICIVLFLCPFLVAFICMISWRLRFPHRTCLQGSRTSRQIRNSNLLTVTTIKEDIPPKYEDVVISPKIILQEMEPPPPSYIEAVQKLYDSTYNNPAFSIDL